MGRQAAADVVAAGGSAVIIGQDPAKVDDTVQALAKEGSADGITADLADREQTERVRQQLAAYDGPTASVNSVSFSPDGSAVLTASNDGIARIWRAVGTERSLVTSFGQVEVMALHGNTLEAQLQSGARPVAA